MRTTNMRLSSSYRKGILFFLLAMLAVVLVALYFTLTKAIITITPNVREIKTDFILDMSSTPVDQNDSVIGGKIEQKIIESSEKFKSTGKKTIETTVDANGLGSVTLFNNLSTKMDLVKKTRLQSKDGTIVRLKNEVSVLPLSSVEVEIYADSPETFTKLEIGKLVLPGLSDKLRDSVYAENSKLISKETRVIDVIEKKDVEDAVLSLSNKMRQESVNNTKLEYSDEGPMIIAFVSEIPEKTVDKAIGGEASEFTVNVKMRVISVFLDRDAVNKKIESRLKNSLKSGERIERLDYDKTKYIIEKYDLENKSAKVKVLAVGQVTIDESHPILNKQKIIGANKKQVEIYFKSFDEVKDVSVMFTPFWVNAVPSMEDKTEIKVR